MKFFRLALALAAIGLPGALGFGGCSSSRYLTVTDYDQSCTQDSDCVPVEMGDVCNSCCANVAINRSAIPQWQSDRSSLDCSGSGELDCAPCPIRAFCRGVGPGEGQSNLPPHCDIQNSDAGP